MSYLCSNQKIKHIMLKRYLFILFLTSPYLGFSQANFVKKLAQGTPQTLVVYGTSIESMEPNGRMWVAKIGEDLNKRYNNLLTIYNSGKSGQHSIWGLENLQDSVIARSPNALMIELATNDAVYDKFGISPDNCRTNTLEMVNRVLEKFPDCEIFLHSPCGFPIGDNLTSRPDMWTYNYVYRDIYLEKGYIWINTANFFREVGENTNLGETVLKAYQGDGVHPTEKGGTEILYPAVLKAMLTNQSVTVSATPEHYGTILKMTPAYFNQSASTDMSAHSYPYNWAAATGLNWTSSNVFAQEQSASTSPFLGKCIRFGKTDASVGTAQTPILDLLANSNETVTLSISLTAGSNKTGTLSIYLDNATTPIFTVSASTGNNGNPFTGAYYTFQIPVIGGTSTSSLRFEHSKTQNGGNIYINSIEIKRTQTEANGLKNQTQTDCYKLIDKNTLVFSEPVQLSIYTIDGRIIRTSKEWKTTSNIDFLKTGIYTIKILNHQNVFFTGKFIKQ